nr:putative ribonuclease H-like domain-containing protein [Tanacetum cinerariifolium]
MVRDANEKKLIQVIKIPTEHNVADLLTKSFDVTRFGYLVVNIEHNVADLLTKSFDVTRFGYLVVNIVYACLVCWTNLLQGNIVHLWFLFTFAGRVTFCWLFPIPAAYPKLGLWYPRDSPFELEAFSDSDYAGAHEDRKSTTGGCQFFGRRFIS